MSMNTFNRQSMPAPGGPSLGPGQGTAASLRQLCVDLGVEAEIDGSDRDGWTIDGEHYSQFEDAAQAIRAAAAN